MIKKYKKSVLLTWKREALADQVISYQRYIEHLEMKIEEAEAKLAAAKRESVVKWNE